LSQEAYKCRCIPYPINVEQALGGFRMQRIRGLRLRYRTWLVAAALIWVLLCLAIVNYGWTRLAAARQLLLEQMIVAVDDILAAVSQGQMSGAEQAAMRLWRLAETFQVLPGSGKVGQQLAELADTMSNIAAGWCVSPVPPASQETVRLQLINLREMIRARDLSQAETVFVWLRTR